MAKKPSFWIRGSKFLIKAINGRQNIGNPLVYASHSNMYRGQSGKKIKRERSMVFVFTL
jgi:hypothetical protein